MPKSDENWTWQCDQVIPSDTAVAERFLEDVLDRLAQLHWGKPEVFGVHLAVHEALINAIDHGNASDKDKHVHVSCRLSPEKFRVEITDEGPGFDPESLPDPTTPERLGCPGGRGVLLMRKFMSRVEFRNNGNRVVLEKERLP